MNNGILYWNKRVIYETTPAPPSEMRVWLCLQVPVHLIEAIDLADLDSDSKYSSLIYFNIKPMMVRLINQLFEKSHSSYRVEFEHLFVYINNTYTDIHKKLLFAYFEADSDSHEYAVWKTLIK